MTWTNALSAEGLEMTLEGDEELAVVLPAFDFDGERKGTFGWTGPARNGFRVGFDGWSYVATGDGEVVDTGAVYGNRNGHYRRLEMRGGKVLRVHLSIRKD